MLKHVQNERNGLPITLYFHLSLVQACIVETCRTEEPKKITALSNLLSLSISVFAFLSPSRKLSVSLIERLKAQKEVEKEGGCIVKVCNCDTLQGGGYALE
jgi:hypothetical protein